jgi:hypothetical protein
MFHTLFWLVSEYQYTFPQSSASKHSEPLILLAGNFTCMKKQHEKVNLATLLARAELFPCL